MGSPVEELYKETCLRIMEMREVMVTDCEAIAARQHDWFLRDHYTNVRRARFTLESSALELERIHLLRNMVTAGMFQPLVTMTGA